MSRRISLAGLFAMLVLIALPASAAAMTYRYQIVSNYCYGDSNSSVYIEVKMIKPVGLSPAMFFSIDGTAQHREVYGGRWSTEWNFGHAEKMLPGNAKKFTWSNWYYREPTDTYRFHRIHLVLKVWSFDDVIASKSVNSVIC